MSAAAEAPAAGPPPVEEPALPDAAVEIHDILAGHGRPGATAAVAYLSFSEPQSFIGACDAAGTVGVLIGFLPLPATGAGIVDAVAGIDDAGIRLVDHYRRRFPDDLARLAGFDPQLGVAQVDALAWLSAATTLVLGLGDDDVERALDPAGAAVGLDTVVVERDGRYRFDTRRLLRSLMSFRIGGVAPATLARSVFDSLGAFTVDAVTRLRRDWPAATVVCAGDLYTGNSIVRDRVRRGLGCLGIPLLDRSPAPAASDPAASGPASSAPAASGPAGGPATRPVKLSPVAAAPGGG